MYLGYTNPLVIQSVVPLKGLFENKLVKIHLLGNPATGELARPWKVSAGLLGMLGAENTAAADPKKEKKTVGKKGTGASKKE